MISGRVVYGLIYWLLLLGGNGALQALSVWGAISTGAIGIFIQFIIIPPLVRICVDYGKMGIRRGQACLIIRVHPFKYITRYESGIKPILDIYQNTPHLLKGKKIYDRVIGKAAAIICVLGGVRCVYGRVMSVSARDYLEKHNIKHSYDELADYIQNRRGDGICPMEACVLDVEDAGEGLARVIATIRS